MSDVKEKPRDDYTVSYRLAREINGEGRLLEGAGPMLCTHVVAIVHAMAEYGVVVVGEVYCTHCQRRFVLESADLPTLVPS